MPISSPKRTEGLEIDRSAACTGFYLAPPLEYCKATDDGAPVLGSRGEQVPEITRVLSPLACTDAGGLAFERAIGALLRGPDGDDETGDSKWHNQLRYAECGAMTTRPGARYGMGTTLSMGGRAGRRCRRKLLR
jgi:hypothetical protein